MTRADLGRATQARFLLDSQREGLLVSLPFDTSIPGYDAIIDNGRRLFRVQVKGARPSTMQRHREGSVYYINTNRHRNSRMQFDVVAVWLDGDGKWCFLPASVRTKKQVVIRPGGRNARRGWEVFRRR